MSVFYESKFQVIEFWENDKILHKSWFPSTEKMNRESFKAEVKKIVEAVNHFKPTKMLDNTNHFTFAIDLELQNWVDTEVFPHFVQAGLRKYALVVSQEMIAQLSIEQTMEEQNANILQVAYFPNETVAKEWLMK